MDADPTLADTAGPGGPPAGPGADPGPTTRVGDGPATPPDEGQETADSPAPRAGAGAGDRGTGPIGGEVAGRYTIRRLLGEGGMGRVYLADQSRPVRRAVALKLIKPGMDSRAVLARFESERQALAMMDHPHIAKVLDAGATAGGRPFFVMELVDGVPLTDYCDRHKLAIRDRLELFRAICAAVQHAHQKGIIHRDLKPSNILVGTTDGRPVPKVIDFGLAKAIGGATLTDRSLETTIGSIAGTPAYMAPEQASLGATDVDTRVDIYALGAILYELLAGSTPIRGETFREAAMEEMLRAIREVDPPPPSSRIAASAALPNLAAVRGVEPSRLGRQVRGELDWIAMKALSKDRRRRYESAVGMADDIGRYLDHEPVAAGPPSATYRLRKFVRRHRGQVAAAALVLLALVGGAIGTTLGLIEARRQERKAVEQAAQTDEARKQAERRTGQVARMNAILGSIFQDFNVNQAEKEGRPLLAVLGERLDRAIAEVEGEATGSPLEVARMRRILGNSIDSLGRPEAAVGVLTRARDAMARLLCADDPETLATAGDLAWSLRNAGQLAEALALCERVDAATRSRLGPEHPDALRSHARLAMSYQAAGEPGRALPIFEALAAAQRTRLGPKHRDTLTTETSLASAYQEAGRLDRALPLFESVEAATRDRLGPDHVESLIAKGNLANACREARQLDRAQALNESVSDAFRAKLGADHPLALNAENNLAMIHHAAGRYDRALPLFVAVAEGRKAKLGPDHPETFASMNNLAFTYHTLGQSERAIPLFEALVASSKAKLGPDHPDTMIAEANLADACRVAGRHDRSVPLYESVVARRRVKLGPDHAETLRAMSNLGLACRMAGQLDRAATTWGELADRLRANPASEPQLLARTLNETGSVLITLKAWDAAATALAESLTIRAAKQPDAGSTHETRSLLGAARLGQDRPAEAGPLLRAGYEGLARQAGPDGPGTPRLRAALDRLIAFGESHADPGEVRAWKAERDRRAASFPPAPVAPAPAR